MTAIAIHEYKPTDGDNRTVANAGLEEQVDAEEDEEMVKPDIPGLKKVWNARYTIIGRFIWSVIMISFTILMLDQVVSRISYYKSSPLAVDLQLHHNTSMMFPDVTVCRSDFFDSDAYDEVKIEVSNVTGIDPSNVTIDDILRLMNIMDLWNRLNLPLDEIVHSCYVESLKMCTLVGKWSPTVTINGICYTYSMAYPVNVSGAVYGLNLVLGRHLSTSNSSESWKLLVHDHSSSPKLESITEGVVVYPSFNMDIRVHIREYFLEPSPGKPCGRIPASQCHIDCISDLVLKKANCRLPFMDNVNASYCTYPNYTLANNLVYQILLGQDPRCYCTPRCHSRSFEISTDTAYFPDRPVTRIRIFYPSFDYSSYQEYVSFDMEALMSDIGGTLGLFLGFSFITILEIVEMLIMKVKSVRLKCWRKSRSSDENEQRNEKKLEAMEQIKPTIQIHPSIDEQITHM